MTPAERQLEHIDKCPDCGAWRWDGACRGACPQILPSDPQPAGVETGDFAA